MIQPLVDCFALDAQIVEVAGVPQGVEVAFQRGLVVHIAGFGEHAGTNRVSRDPSITVDHDLRHDVLLRQARSSKEDKSE